LASALNHSWHFKAAKAFEKKLVQFLVVLSSVSSEFTAGIEQHFEVQWSAAARRSSAALRVPDAELF